MKSVYHIVTIRVNETSWAHVWRLRSRYLGTGYDSETSVWMFCGLGNAVKDYVVIFWSYT
jgi:hypothetical protein